MNCSKVNRLLPVLITGDLKAEDHDSVHRHLNECASCRETHNALRQLLHTLDTLPARPVQVDVPRLYEQAAIRQKRNLARWRRGTVAIGAIAASLLLLVFLRWELRIEQHQLVLRWGLPAETTELSIANRKGEKIASNAALPENVTLNNKLIHALAARIERFENDNNDELARLRDEVVRLRLITDGRWTDSQRQFRVLYTAQFGSANEGGVP